MLRPSFILNTLFFSQAFFSLSAGFTRIVKTFAGSIADDDAPEPTNDASAII
jgi:hypothetical protein